MPNSCPKLRPIHAEPVNVQNRPALMLHDPLRLSGKVLFFPQALAPMLAFCDGTRTLDELRASLMVRAGISLPLSDLERILSQLDEAYLLENERSAGAMREAREAYRSAPFRPATLAGRGYPAEPEALREFLDGYLQGFPAGTNTAIRGLVSPHIDFERGGPVYAQVWSQAAAAIRQAEVVVILGTDHNGDYGRITLTQQSYATPYGVLPTDAAVVDAVAEAIGEQAAFAEELHHQREHSIELAAVWLHHMRGGQPCALVPVLTGSFSHYVQGEAGDPAGDETFGKALETMDAALQGRQALWVAAGDLAHIGPAFDGRPVDALGKAQLQAQDEGLVGAICAGDAGAFFQAIRAERDQRNVCGLPPIYLMLRALGGAHGEVAGYDRCPADSHDTSFVSICGAVLT